MWTPHGTCWSCSIYFLSICRRRRFLECHVLVTFNPTPLSYKLFWKIVLTYPFFRAKSRWILWWTEECEWNFAGRGLKVTKIARSQFLLTLIRLYVVVACRCFKALSRNIIQHACERPRFWNSTNHTYRTKLLNSIPSTIYDTNTSTLIINNLTETSGLFYGTYLNSASLISCQSGLHVIVKKFKCPILLKCF